MKRLIASREKADRIREIMQAMTFDWLYILGGLLLAYYAYYLTTRNRHRSKPSSGDGPESLDSHGGRDTLKSDAQLALDHFVDNKVHLSAHRYHAENLTILFLAEYLAKNSRHRPKESEWLREWDKRDVPESLKSIRTDALHAIQSRLRSLAATDLEWILAENERKAYLLIEKNVALVQRFFEIAYRKVVTPDEYGEERPLLFDEEMKRLFAKLDDPGLKRHGSLEDHRFRAKVESLLREGFKKYYSHRKSTADQTDTGRLATMTGPEFEAYLAERLRTAGVNDISSTPATGDQGADLLFSWNGKTFVVQAKRYKAAVGNKAVQEAHAAKGYYRRDEAWVVTNSRFTQSARALAKELSVVLVDRDHLVDFHSFLRIQLRR